MILKTSTHYTFLINPGRIPAFACSSNNHYDLSQNQLSNFYHLVFLSKIYMVVLELTSLMYSIISPWSIVDSFSVVLWFVEFVYLFSFNVELLKLASNTCGIGYSSISLEIYNFTFSLCCYTIDRRVEAFDFIKILESLISFNDSSEISSNFILFDS